MNPTLEPTSRITSLRSRGRAAIARLIREEEGAETAEYAIVIMAAVALAAST